MRFSARNYPRTVALRRLRRRELVVKTSLKSVLDAGGVRSALPRLNHNITQENWIVRHAARFPAKITVKMVVFDENRGPCRLFLARKRERDGARRSMKGERNILFRQFRGKDREGWFDEEKNVINDRLWLRCRSLKRVISTRLRSRRHMLSLLLLQGWIFCGYYKYFG